MFTFAGRKRSGGVGGSMLCHRRDVCVDGVHSCWEPPRVCTAAPGSTAMFPLSTETLGFAFRGLAPASLIYIVFKIQQRHHFDTCW